MSRFVLSLLLTISALAQTPPSAVPTPTPTPQKEEALLNKLFAPGPLAEPHHALEASDCLKCHDAGKGLNEAKCLSCHKIIRPFVDGKKGFHGLTGRKCFECHADHKGRQHDTTYVEQKSFEHSRTGFALEGKHKELKCEQCHINKRTHKSFRPTETRYLGAMATCVSCHKKHDPHRFQGKYAKFDCNKCHSEISFKKDTKFNHDTETRFVLVGIHKTMKCAECHTKKGIKYSWPNLKAGRCLACHKDVHGNRLSARFQKGQCTTCHTQNTWKQESFDHRITGFQLRGKHAENKCTDCHKQSVQIAKLEPKFYMWKGLKQNCLDCHKDYHGYSAHKMQKFKSLNSCTSCHSEKGWQETHDFNHDGDTRFAINGEHSKLKCNDCHTPDKLNPKLSLRPVSGRGAGIYKWQNLNIDSCKTCHRSPHEKTFSKAFLKKKCTECHVTTGWKQRPFEKDSSFNHSQTRFQLTGRHSQLNCADCHSRDGKQMFQFAHFEEKFCVDCHQSPHTKQFDSKFSSRSCLGCHNTKEFSKLESFNHDETNFKISGKHKELKCTECHTVERQSSWAAVPGKSKPKKYTWHKFTFEGLSSKSCTTCHSDFHKGQMGPKCNTCHSEQGWPISNFDHDLVLQFPLKGEHKKAKCQQCHYQDSKEFVFFGKPPRKLKLTRYKLKDTQCFTCHQGDDIHNGGRGTNCASCHMERGWKYTKDFHKNFTLHGVHYTLQCSECHVNDRKLSGMTENCVLCHKKDDIHSGTLPRCSECHQQQVWEHTNFRHSMTNFPLRGTHRTLDCFSCHNRGVYIGTRSTCVSCHQNDVNNSNFNHNAVPDLECSQCHNQFTFQR